MHCVLTNACMLMLTVIQFAKLWRNQRGHFYVRVYCQESNHSNDLIDLNKSPSCSFHFLSFCPCFLLILYQNNGDIHVRDHNLTWPCHCLFCFLFSVHGDGASSSQTPGWELDLHRDRAPFSSFQRIVNQVIRFLSPVSLHYFVFALSACTAPGPHSYSTLYKFPGNYIFRSFLCACTQIMQ